MNYNTKNGCKLHWTAKDLLYLAIVTAVAEEEHDNSTTSLCFFDDNATFCFLFQSFVKLNRSFNHRSFTSRTMRSPSFTL